MTPIDYALTFTTAYSRSELELLWSAVQKVGVNGTIIEIGVDYGASTSLYFHRSRELYGHLDLILIDDRSMNPAPAWRRFCDLVCDFPDVRFTFHCMRSGLTEIPEMRCADLKHIDSSHSYYDTIYELRMLPQALCTVLHDFDRGPEFEGVGRAAREYFMREPDKLVGTCALYERRV